MGSQRNRIARYLGAWLLLILLPFLVSACSWGSVENYGDENEEILDSLPTFPGAREVERRTSGYSLGGERTTHGYSTIIIYELHEDSTIDEVITFYTGALPEWESEREVTQCMPKDCEVELVRVEFTKDPARINLGLANVNSVEPGFQLSVDARYCQTRRC